MKNHVDISLNTSLRAGTEKTVLPPFQLLTQIESDSPALIRDHNRNLLLDTVRLQQPISRIGLSRATGLTPSTISSHVDQLLKDGLIREAHVVPGPRGRHPTMLFLNDRLAFLVADITATRAAVAAMDVRGVILNFSYLPAGGNVENLIRAVGARMAELQTQLTSHIFKGVGVSLPGRIHPLTKQLSWAPSLGWSSFDVAGYLAQELGLGVDIVHMANAGLLTELWFSKQLAPANAVLVSVTEEVSAAAVIKSQLVLGHRGLAGNFGHVMHKSNGRACRCGRYGCLEMYASTTAALRNYQEISGLSQPVPLSRLLDLIAANDAAAQRAIKQQAIALACALRSVTATLDPEVIFLSGDIASYWNHVRTLFEKELSNQLQPESVPRIECVGDGVFARLRGAGAAILQRNSGRHQLTGPAQELPFMHDTRNATHRGAHSKP